MFGVSFDSVEANRAFAEKSEFPFRLLCDTERELGLAYGTADRKDDAFARRHTFVVGPDGKLEHPIATKDLAGQAQALLTLLG